MVLLLSRVYRLDGREGKGGSCLTWRGRRSIDALKNIVKKRNPADRAEGRRKGKGQTDRQASKQARECKCKSVTHDSHHTLSPRGVFFAMSEATTSHVRFERQKRPPLLVSAWQKYEKEQVM